MASVFKRAISLLSFPMYKKKMEQCYKSIVTSDNYESKVLLLTNAYKFMKQVSEDIYINNRKNTVYDYLVDKLLDCEEELSYSFIVESDPIFDENHAKYNGKSFIRYETNEDVLDFIVWTVRKKLLNDIRRRGKYNYSLKDLSLVNECRKTSYMIKKVCDDFGIECVVVKIEPIFTNEIELFGGDGFHYYAQVKLNNKEYIVDCTYRQFFVTSRNIFERMGVVSLSGCYPGVYMLENKSRKNTALSILKKGYVEATLEHLKNYYDGFTLSYRNGLYYEWIGKIDYNVDYSLDDYDNFFNGRDSILEHELLRGLGQQWRKLKNPKLEFNPRKNKKR